MELTRAIWIILLPAFETLWAGAVEVKVGQLYEQKGYWRQDGVVLLLYRVPVTGNLTRFRTRVRLLHSLWIQVWEKLIDRSGDYFKLKNQWQYLPEELDIEEVLVQPFSVSPRDFVGFFIADGLECPLEYELIDLGEDAIGVYGSAWLNHTYQLPIGKELPMGNLGYRLKYAIEYYFDGGDAMEETTLSEATAIPSVSTSTNATTSPDVITVSDITPSSQVTMPLTPAEDRNITGSLRSHLNVSQVFLRYGLPSIITLLMMTLFAGALFYFIKRRRSEESRPYIETSSPIYNVPINLTGSNQSGNKVVRNGTVSSGVYTELDEKKMENTEAGAVKTLE